MVRNSILISGLVAIFATGGIGYYVFGGHIDDATTDADVEVIEQIEITNDYPLDYGMITTGDGKLTVNSGGLTGTPQGEMNLSNHSGDVHVYPSSPDPQPAGFTVTGRSGSTFDLEITDVTHPDEGSVDLWIDESDIDYTDDVAFDFESGAQPNIQENDVSATIDGGDIWFDSAVGIELTGDPTPDNYEGSLTYEVQYL